MSAAVLGLVGVVVGFMLGRGYEFWAVHHAELGAAIAATAALAEELRNYSEREASPIHDDTTWRNEQTQTQASQRVATCEQLRKTWKEGRAALTVFISPPDAWALAKEIQSASLGGAERQLDDLARRMHDLHNIFWQEQQLFILVAFLRLIPPVRQLSRYRSVPQQIHEKLTQLPPPVSTAD